MNRIVLLWAALCVITSCSREVTAEEYFGPLIAKQPTLTGQETIEDRLVNVSLVSIGQVEVPLKGDEAVISLLDWKSACLTEKSTNYQFCFFDPSWPVKLAQQKTSVFSYASLGKQGWPVVISARPLNPEERLRHNKEFEPDTKVVFTIRTIRLPKEGDK